ncbi:hypothetical protein EJ03DRAFT_347556 [Teratosphaeria nubilosa]|uniref:Uncharacterized protein n=1 Tax=Teratosphaeria nubilosa TaxID=161662 RepID=A0A6G1LKZ5_9PEZI|nr:hypothetical protein EJ03DRAFT_347556 [Teratosphaeria nubilosa]
MAKRGKITKKRGSNTNQQPPPQAAPSNNDEHSMSSRPSTPTPPLPPQNPSMASGSISPFQLPPRRIASAPGPPTIAPQDSAPQTPHQDLELAQQPTAAAAAPPLSLATCLHLIWQVLHLTNVLTSQLGAYLSLETLDRNARVHGWTVPIPQRPILEAQMTMMADCAKNLRVAVAMLRPTEWHCKAIACGSYRSLMEGVQRLEAVMEVMREGGVEKTVEEVRGLRGLCDELTVLCHGSMIQGVDGWKGCWDEVHALCRD